MNNIDSYEYLLNYGILEHVPYCEEICFSEYNFLFLFSPQTQEITSTLSILVHVASRHMQVLLHVTNNCQVTKTVVLPLHKKNLKPQNNQMVNGDRTT